MEAVSIPRSEWATLKPPSSNAGKLSKQVSIPRSEWATLKLAAWSNPASHSNFNSSFGMGYPETWFSTKMDLDQRISIPRSEWATLKRLVKTGGRGSLQISIPRSEWATLKRRLLCLSADTVQFQFLVRNGLP